MIRNVPSNFHPTPQAAFLTTKRGQLSEKAITKEDIKSFVSIANTRIQSNIDTLNKLIFLRRLLDINGNHDNAWQLISNILKKRSIPKYKDSHGNIRDMTPQEIASATVEIQNAGITNFNYSKELQKVQNNTLLRQLYAK